MDNQHRKIKGYRELNAQEVAAMNLVKDLAAATGQLVAEFEKNPCLDQRWVEVAKTTLQTGYMQLTRAVAQPSTF